MVSPIFAHQKCLPNLHLLRSKFAYFAGLAGCKDVFKIFLFFLPAPALPEATVEEEDLRRATRDQQKSHAQQSEASRSRNFQKIGEEEYLQQIKEIKQQVYKKSESVENPCN